MRRLLWLLPAMLASIAAGAADGPAAGVFNLKIRPLKPDIYVLYRPDPLRQPVEPNVLWTEASTQTIVAVMDPLEVAQWDLPPTWRQSIQTPTRAGETLLIADGPPPQSAHASPRTKPGPWKSRRRLQNHSVCIR